MKQKFSILLIIALFSGMLANVQAAENVLTAQYRYDGLQDALIVDGTVTGEKGNIWLTLDIAGPDGEFLLGKQTTAKANNFEQILSYAFEPVRFGTDFPSGTYTLEISGYEIAQPVTLTFEYAGVDVLFEAMQKVDAAIAEHDPDGVYQAIFNNAEQLGVVLEDMQALAATGKAVFSELMMDAEWDIPENIDTDENRERVKAAALDFRKAFADAVAIGEYNDIQDTEDIKAWLEAYASAYSLAEDDEATEVNEAELYPYIEKIMNEAAFVSRIAKQEQRTTIREIRDALYEGALLSIIETHHYSETKEIIDSFPNLFPVNRTRFGQLSSTRQGEVYESVAGKAYENYAQVTSAFDQAVNAFLGSSGGNGGGNTSSSGSSTGWGSEGVSGVGVITAQPSAEPEQTQELFHDLDNTAWAKDAILYLAEKEVVSGKEEGIFSPDDPVTRAEFTKMIVTAVNAPMAETGAGFADVAESDWFYPYINAAQQAGLVMGDENNCFNPNAQITRQDMAVILYRAYEVNAGSAEADFADAGEISAYALEAVAYFHAEGVIAGMGDGRFAPKDTATRAQAAVMLYNVMTKL